MAKKHRVKRANYVKHLLEVEKKRESYLDKRKNRKRGRAELNEEDIFDETRAAALQASTKRHRKDPASDEATTTKNEEPAEHAETHAPVAPKTNPFAALQAQSGAATSGGFFDVSQTAPLTAASAPTTTSTTAAKKKVASKKKY